MALAPDDPARAKIAELREKNASAEEILAAMETYGVSLTLIVKALSPGHAKHTASWVVQHMVDTHLEPGVVAISSVQEPERMAWLDGPLFGGELH